MATPSPTGYAPKLRPVRPHADIAQVLNEQATQLEDVMGALRAVSSLAGIVACARHNRGCDELDPRELAGLAATVARAVQVTTQELNEMAAELELAGKPYFG